MVELPALLAELGVDPAEVFEGTDVDPETLDAETRITFGDLATNPRSLGAAVGAAGAGPAPGAEVSARAWAGHDGSDPSHDRDARHDLAVGMRSTRSSDRNHQMTGRSAKETLLGSLDLTPLSTVTTEVHARPDVV
jgi:hypothetical protein